MPIKNEINHLILLQNLRNKTLQNLLRCISFIKLYHEKL